MTLIDFRDIAKKLISRTGVGVLEKTQQVPACHEKEKEQQRRQGTLLNLGVLPQVKKSPCSSDKKIVTAVSRNICTRDFFTWSETPRSKRASSCSCCCCSSCSCSCYVVLLSPWPSDDNFC